MNKVYERGCFYIIKTEKGKYNVVDSSQTVNIIYDDGKILKKEYTTDFGFELADAIKIVERKILRKAWGI
jgi:dephospho-CoA kinase